MHGGLHWAGLPSTAPISLDPRICWSTVKPRFIVLFAVFFATGPIDVPEQVDCYVVGWQKQSLSVFGRHKGQIL